MMEHIVYGLTQDFVCRISQHLLAGFIDKGASTPGIGAENTFPHRLQNQLAVLFGLFEFLSPLRHLFFQKDLVACQLPFGLLGAVDAKVAGFFSLQRPDPLQAERGHKSGKSAQKPQYDREFVFGNDWNLIQGFQVTGRVKSEFLRLLQEMIPVWRGQEKLPHKNIGDMPALDHDRASRVGQAVLAGVNRKGFAFLEICSQFDVTFDTAGACPSVNPVKIGTDTLPARRSQYIALEVNDGGSNPDGVAEICQYLAQLLQIKEFRQRNIDSFGSCRTLAGPPVFCG